MEKSSSLTRSKMIERSLIAGVVLASLFLTPAYAVVPEPGIVIHDAGGASDITNWVDESLFDSIKGQLDVDQMQAMVKSELDHLDVQNTAVPQLFPIKPTLIKPNPLPGTKILKKIPNLPQPLFVIGNDEYSLRWFKANREILEQYGAMGILTTAKNKSEWEFMQEVVAPLRLFPMNADVLVDQLGLPGYPLLITKGGFFQ
ncbi:MAG: integrating conjugative element protein [Aeromonadaceae bacterium]|nr:integrating conjugative element protein [Aeromonadaceae bacterium]